ncbi:hypothetical protein GINT2_001365 [Glugoides intestinalis]
METPEKLSLDSNSINTAVIMSLTGFYILARSLSSTTPILNLIKGKFRSITGLLLKLSVISAIVYNITIYYLSMQFDVDRFSLEIFHKFDHTSSFSYNGYKIDLALLLLTSLKIAEALFVSCVFLSISLIGSTFESTASIDISIIAISKLWAVLRLLVVFYLAKFDYLVAKKLILFVQMILCNIEFGIASFFVLILKFRVPKGKGLKCDAGFFSLCLLTYGFLKYSVNFIDFPFKIESRALNIMWSLQYGLFISIYLMMATITFPRKHYDSLKKIKEDPISISGKNNVAILEEIIEFEESKALSLTN